MYSWRRRRHVRSTLSNRDKSAKFDGPRLVFIALIAVGCLLVYISLPSASILAHESRHAEALGKTIESKQLASAGYSPLSSMITVDGEETPLRSAKTLLKMQPPFEDSQAVKIADNLIKSQNTVVTGYFRVPSKYTPGKYDKWMRNMLSLQDAMVIFTQKEMINQVKELRSHAENRTVIIPLEIDQLPYATLYSKEFWQDQLNRDPEKQRHKSYQLFWIWLSKSWLTTQAIRMNWFDSDLYVWSDIGCFRTDEYNFKTMIQHREVVPPTEMLQMAHHKPNPPPERLYNDKYQRKANFYHSGSQFAGYKETWLKFHEYFLEIIDGFLTKHMIILEDQAVLQSTCLSHPEICAYLPFTEVNDNHYFGLRYALHHGGNYLLWRQNRK